MSINRFLIGLALTISATICIGSTNLDSKIYGMPKESVLVGLPYLTTIAILIFLFLILPEINRNFKHKQRVKSLKVGQTIKLRCGIVGKIININGIYLTIESGNGSSLVVDRNALSVVLEPNAIPKN